MCVRVLYMSSEIYAKIIGQHLKEKTMKLSDIRTLVKTVPILIAVALYLIFAPDKDDTAVVIESAEAVITPAYAEEQTGNTRYEVKYKEANDGDTFSVDIDGKTERIRLLMVDTPEMNYKEDNPQPYAEEAKAFTIDILENAQKIEVLHDVGDERDHYDRLLAYVFVDDVLLQEHLLAQGFAAVRYAHAPNNTLEQDFYTIQDKAEKAKLNVWAHEGYFTKQGFDASVIE